MRWKEKRWGQDPEEAKERSAEGGAPGSLLGHTASEQESAILRRRRWPARVGWGLAVLAFLVWSWWNFLSQRFGPLFSLGGGGDFQVEEVASYLQEDTNLVKLVQSRLRSLGYQVGSVDGVVGPKTVEALEKFQAQQGLPVTGVLDRATKTALEKIPLPKEETPPYIVARVSQRQEERGKRLQVDLSVDPASDKETVEGYVRKVLGQYARRHPEVQAIQVRAYLGIASLASGAYAIADWERLNGESSSDPEGGIKIQFQEWARETAPVFPQFPPPER